MNSNLDEPPHLKAYNNNIPPSPPLKAKHAPQPTITTTTTTTTATTALDDFSRLKGYLTNPSQAGLFCLGTNVSDPTQIAFCRDNNIKSWLHLITPDSSTGSPSSIYNVDGVNSRRVLVNSTDVNALTLKVAYDCITVLDSLPRPTLITCASGARATVVARMYLAKQQQSKVDVSVDDMVAAGTSLNEEWLNKPALVNWLTRVMKPSFVFRQLFEKESSTYTYLIGDTLSGEGILIDPVDVTVDRDLSVAYALGIHVIYGLNTHAHADHITGTSILRAKILTSDNCYPFKSAISKSSGAKADIIIDHGDKLHFGKRYISARSTPGHTAGCTSFVLDDDSMVFTGDTLLIKGCGRTDFQDGSSSMLYDSVHTQLFTLPETCAVYPAHDYQGRTSTSIGEEISMNPRLGMGKSKGEFESIMENLKLSRPKLIDVAVPKNINCGV